MNRLKKIGVAVIVTGAICTLGILLYTSFSAEAIDAITIIFYIWALAPYMVLFLLTLRVHRSKSSAAARVATFSSSLAVVILSVFFYYDAIFLSMSSTSVLVFIYVPAYALVAIVAVYLATKFLIGFRKER